MSIIYDDHYYRPLLVYIIIPVNVWYRRLCCQLSEVEHPPHAILEDVVLLPLPTIEEELVLGLLVLRLPVLLLVLGEDITSQHAAAGSPVPSAGVGFAAHQLGTDATGHLHVCTHYTLGGDMRV